MRSRRIPLTLILALFTILCVSGCSEGSKDREGLEVKSLMVTFAEEENRTSVSYNFKLWNGSSEAVTVATVEPVLSEVTRKRLVGEDIHIVLNQTIEPGTSASIKGFFLLDTKGMVKRDILNPHSDLKNFKVTTEHVL